MENEKLKAAAPKHEKEEPKLKADVLTSEEFERKFKEKIHDGDADALFDMGLVLLKQIDSIRGTIAVPDRDGFVEELIKDPSTREQILTMIEEDRLTRERETFEAAHDDYEIVMEAFVDAHETSQNIKDKWVRAGKTVEAAYNIGKELLEVREIIKDPAKWKERQLELLKTEKSEEFKVKKNGVPKTLSTEQSKSGASKTANHFRDGDHVLESLGIV